MLCPYCLIEVHFDDCPYELGRVSSQDIQLVDYKSEGNHRHCFRGAYCPKCKGAIVAYIHLPVRAIPKDGTVVHDVNEFEDIVYPKRVALKPLPAEVPQDYQGDFEEARLALGISPKSSAALCRRLLQRILHERFDIDRPNLQQEIQEFVSTLVPPTHLAQQLDAVRLVGNFAAHPMKDTNTGSITDVEEGEAELLIETLESMFDYAFVQPAKWAASKAPGD